MRGRNNGSRRNNGPTRSQHFDSNGPDVKVRGNAQQVVEKYLALAREAATAGDPVMAENYYQHAEHYYRLQYAGENGGPRPQTPGVSGDGNGSADADFDDSDGHNGQPSGVATHGTSTPTNGQSEPQTT